jgi:ATP-binding cassette subfamily B multidrug efflux pump
MQPRFLPPEDEQQLAMLARRQVQAAQLGRSHLRQPGQHGGNVGATQRLFALQTIVKHQTLAINFPLRLRWNFHRLMLGQSLAFYSDEFAGRITTKVMQTALAVREMLFTTTEVIIGIGVYFVTILALAGAFDRADAALPRLVRSCYAVSVLCTSCRAWAASASSRPMRGR